MQLRRHRALACTASTTAAGKRSMLANRATCGNGWQATVRPRHCRIRQSHCCSGKPTSCAGRPHPRSFRRFCANLSGSGWSSRRSMSKGRWHGALASWESLASASLGFSRHLGAPPMRSCGLDLCPTGKALSCSWSYCNGSTASVRARERLRAHRTSRHACTASYATALHRATAASPQRATLSGWRRSGTMPALDYSSGQRQQPNACMRLPGDGAL